MTPDAIDDAVAHLRAGRLVAFPTETVYGLGADAADPDAVARLYSVKGRPTGHPVIVHVATAEQLDTVAADVPDWARALVARHWPGPLTLVVRRRPGAVCDAVTGGRDTVGVRVPDHPVATALLTRFAGGVAAPSANRFGRVSPTTAEHVRSDLGDDVAAVLDGGACAVGVESTIVDATGPAPVVLRLGAVTAEQIEAATGLTPTDSLHGAVAAPGTLASHYAPDATVEIVTATELSERVGAHLRAGRRIGVLAPDGITAEHLAAEPLIAGKSTADAPTVGPADAVSAPSRIVVLPPPADAAAYAHDLYARLRDADLLGLDVVVVVPPGGAGIAAAVTDRLRRAATVRE